MGQNLFRFSWILWGITIIFSWWFIPPRIDDGIYLYPAISVLNNLSPSGIIGNNIIPIFYIFPTQPFLHGVFLKFLNIFSVDIGINTYRLFNYFVLIILFYSVNKLFQSIIESHKSFYASWLFFVLIGLSQFSVQFFINRPELLALFFFTIGIKSAFKFIEDYKKNIIHLGVAFFSLGVTITLHPNFIIPSGLLVIYLLFLIIENRRLNYFGLIVFFLIPSTLFLGWFLVNFDIAFEQLYGRVSITTHSNFFTLESPRHMFSTIFGISDKSLIHKLYLGLHMFTLLIELLVLLFLSLLSSKYYCLNERSLNLVKVSSFATILLFFLMESWPGSYLTVAFLSFIYIIIYLFSLSVEKITVLNRFYGLISRKKLKILAYAFSVFFILSLPIFQSLKVYASNNQYFDHHKTLTELDGHLLDTRHLFINTPHLLPLFAKEINNNFLNKESNGIYVHWYFPVSPDSPSIKSQEMMFQSILNDNAKMNGAIWGTLKKYYYQDNKSACLILAARKHYLKFDSAKVLYEDRDNIFFKSNKANLTTKEKCNG